MSIGGIGEQVMDALHRAHSLFGNPSSSGGATARAAGLRVSSARDLLSSAKSNISAAMSGQFATAYAQRAAATGRDLRAAAKTDGVLSEYLEAAAAANRSGRNASAGVVDGAAADIARLGPLSDTPAGQRALLGALRNRVSQHDAIVQDHRERSAQIATNVALLDFSPASPDGGVGPDVSFAVGEERKKRDEEIEDLVRRSLEGDKDAAQQVDDILDGIDPNQLQPHTDPNNPGATLPPVPLEPDQAEVISQMQAQMSGKSLDELVKLKTDLGEHGDIIGDSMQVMSDPDVKFPLDVDEQFEGQVPPGIDTESMSGGKGMLPQSVQDALDAQAVSRDITDPNQTVPVTTYPSGDDLKKVSELIKAGDTQFQQGSELDRSMMDRAVDVLHGAEQENQDYFKNSNPEGDSIVQDIFNSAGRDQIVSHDMITEPNSTFLDDVARHEWTDNGASVRTLTDWVHDGATSSDPDVALRAGETANALSSYLGDKGDDLLNLKHPGGLGNSEDITVGQMNPDLVQGWGNALDPYQKSMLGDGQLPGFEPVPGTANSEFTEMRNIFAVMDSDPTAANAWNETAYEHILEYQRNPDYNNLANAGAMLGVVDSAAVQEMESRGANNLDNQKAIYDMKKAALGAALGWPAGQMPVGLGGTLADLTIKGMIGSEPTVESVPSNAPTTTVADAMNQTNYYIAEDLVRKDPDLGEMAQYVNTDGSLMKPEDIPASQLRDYYLDMQEYVANRGFANAMGTFYTQYQNAGGINVPKGFVPPG